MANCSKERSHSPATQIQTHVISNRADDVPFLGFREGERYFFVEALEVVVNLTVLHYESRI